MTLGPHHGLHPLHGAHPGVPGLRRGVDPRPRQQVAAVEEQPRVDVPGQRPDGAVDDVGVPDAGEVVLGVHHRGAFDPRVEALQRAERHELRDPGRSELEDVRHRLADVGGEKLLVRRAPGDLLHADAEAGMFALELRHQLGHHLALAAEGPELDGGPVLGAAPAAERQQRGDGERARAGPKPRIHPGGGPPGSPAGAQAPPASCWRKEA